MHNLTSFYRSNELQYLELFLSNASFLTLLRQTQTMPQPATVGLSMSSKLMLEELLLINSVITFGIQGDCILEELRINGSIDDIHGN